jgi:hypothetical protein
VGAHIQVTNRVIWIIFNFFPDCSTCVLFSIKYANEYNNNFHDPQILSVFQLPD